MQIPSYLDLIDHGVFVRMEDEDEIYLLDGKEYRAEFHYIPSIRETKCFVVPCSGVPCIKDKPDNKQS